MKRIIVVLAFVCCSMWVGATGTSSFTLEAAFGPHPVGFRIVHQYDHRRAYKGRYDVDGTLVTGERSRPLQTMIWYPAKPDRILTPVPMPYGRYLELLASEDNFTPDDQQRAAVLKLTFKSPELMNRYGLERVRVTKAFRDAPPQASRFPVVIYAPSFSAPAFENSDLCEYLASHGYIVISTPSIGAHSRFMTADLQGVEAQVSDIEFLIGYARNMPEADSSRIAVVGFSSGGLANVFAAIEDSRISAVVSLDGSIRYAAGLIKEAQFVSPKKLTAAFMYLAGRTPSLEEISKSRMDTSYSFLNEVRYSDFYFVDFPTADHLQFCSYCIRFVFHPDMKAVMREHNMEEINQAYSWMTRYVLEFLQAHLKREPAALQFLKDDPVKNSVPRHLLAVTSRSALNPAPCIEDFARELATAGFERAIETYEQARKKDAGFQLEQREVNNWGYGLLRSGDISKAIAVFRLNVAIHPEHWKPYYTLAEAQIMAGDKKQAIANLRKSLQLDRDNASVIQRLKELEASAPQ